MKTIVILSSEPWGKMMLSKMHFATEFAKRGDKVFFVNPPDTNFQPKETEPVPEGITIISLKPIKYRRFLLHKANWLYKLISKRYIKEIKNSVNGKIDELWCFNPHILLDLKLFHADVTLLLLYDFYTGKYIKRIINSADGLVSISRIILDHYSDTTPKKLFIQHGLSSPFVRLAEERVNGNIKWRQSGKLKIGYSGNLLIQGLDTSSMRKIILSNPDIVFHFWGAYANEGNNLAGYGANPEGELFVEFLSTMENVFLHGMKSISQLASEIQQMDAFIIFYDAEKGISKASNSHKIMEFLSTGKVIISSPISNYEGTDYFPMANEKVRLVELFDQVINNLEAYNHPSLQRKRIEFALENSYSKQIERIEEWLKLI